ncbi:MAG: hypothetical protein ACOX0K_01100 [Oscillospiraceae bacterium]
MSIGGDLIANRLAYQKYFQKEQEREELLLPSLPPVEEEAFAFPAVEAPQPQPVYPLEAHTSSLFPQGLENSSSDDDELLDRLVYRLDRESRLMSQPLLEE